MLLGAERLRRRVVATDSRGSDERLARLSWRNAGLVGTSQAIGLVPGFSRSGATMSAGLLAGLSNEDSARFAFLLATPIIGAAALLKIPDLLGPAGDGVRGPGRGRRRLRRADDLLRRQVPAALLRDQPPDPVRHLLPRGRRPLTLAFAVGL